ncbi:TIGR03557 family F420-dependent LLM class oxidoreductase [Methanobacterium sp. ACI-7]|uniref:TIGR03557 family F420-dependent LLM class oxidoreductase n=1 Tax=unclassified Methanobacterium TaxID=2627676 RepID=UPI0039C1EBD4
MKVGYKLGSEKYSALDLVCFSKQAEDAGFDYAMISDHFHPWTNKQGNSPFVWGTIGGISQVTDRIPIVTGVTCPTVRIHPAIIAQAAATAASMLPGRFIFGVGSGESLNEHIFGDEWPSTPTRIEMLEEAIDVIRTLWTEDEELVDYDGFYYNVENARIYTKPKELTPIYIAAEGDLACDLAGREGDGLIAQTADEGIVKKFQNSGGKGKPCYGEAVVCWAETKEEAKKQAYEIWPIKANTVQLNADLPTPSHFEQLAGIINEDIVAEQMVCSNDPQDFIDELRSYEKAGFDHVCINHVGKNQHEFIEFCQNEILPEFRN